MKVRSKRYRKNSEMFDRNQRYEIADAIRILKKFDGLKFDETVDIAILLGIDPKRQQVRGAYSLPHGIGKEKRVVVFAEGPKAEEAAEAGAVEVGGQDLVKKIQDGWLDFDVAVAVPAMMRFVGRLGKVLGPQGKMPSPKSGTVTDQVGVAVREFRAGKIEFRNDKGANIHAPVGKLAFPAEKLEGNLNAFLEHVKTLKPAQSKGVFVKQATLSSTGSPGVKLAI